MDERGGIVAPHDGFIAAASKRFHDRPARARTLARARIGGGLAPAVRRGLISRPARPLISPHQSPSTPLRDRATGAVAATCVIGLLGYGLMIGLAAGHTPPRAAPTSPVRIALPPLRIMRTPKAHVARQEPANHRPSPPALRNKATDVLAPVPVILLSPPPIPIVAATRANAGATATSGLSNQPGSGSGMGGDGDGLGGGGAGDGHETPPRFRRGKLKYADLPAALRLRGAEGTVGVRYAVETDGRIGDCDTRSSSGDKELDAATCGLIRRRFLYHPSRDANDRPVRSIVEDDQSWIVDRAVDRPSHP